MKLEISQSAYKAIVRLSNETGFIVISKAVDLATNEVYLSEVKCVPLKQSMTPNDLNSFIGLALNALFVTSWMEAHMKTPQDFTKVDLPSKIQDYL